MRGMGKTISLKVSNLKVVKQVETSCSLVPLCGAFGGEKRVIQGMVEPLRDPA
jgi:hypothetical protein